MTIAFDASAEKETATGPSTPQTWTHTPVGAPKGICVAIVQLAGSTDTSTDYIASVTYGGVAMTRVRRAIDNVGAMGAADLWYLGAGIPTGAQTVSVGFNAVPTVRFHLVSLSFTAAANTEVVDSESIDNDQSNPQLPLQYSGRTALAVCAGYFGRTLPGDLVVNGTCTVVQTYAPTSTGTSSVVFRQTTPGSADFTIGGTLVNCNAAFAAAAFAEVSNDPPTSTLQNPTHRFASAGTYAVTLQVTDVNGNVSQVVSHNVVVS